MWNAPVSSASGPKKYSRRTLMNRALAVGLSLSAPALLLQGCSGSGTLESSLNFTNWASAETATRTNIDKALAILRVRTTFRSIISACPLTRFCHN